MSTDLVFIFIFVIVVIGFILTIGSKLIGDVFGLGCNSQLQKQVTELKNSVYTENGGGLFWTSTGSTNAIDISTPDCIEKICFFNPDAPGRNTAGNWEGDPILEKLITERKFSAGVFRASGDFEGYNVEKLVPSKNFCINRASSSTQLILTNKGKSVDISSPGER